MEADDDAPDAHMSFAAAMVRLNARDIQKQPRAVIAQWSKDEQITYYEQHAALCRAAMATAGTHAEARMAKREIKMHEEFKKILTEVDAKFVADKLAQRVLFQAKVTELDRLSKRNTELEAQYAKGTAELTACRAQLATCTAELVPCRERQRRELEEEEEEEEKETRTGPAPAARGGKQQKKKKKKKQPAKTAAPTQAELAKEAEARCQREMAAMRVEMTKLEEAAARNAAFKTRAEAGDAAVQRFEACDVERQALRDAEKRRTEILLLGEFEHAFSNSVVRFIVPNGRLRSRFGIRSMHRLAQFMAEPAAESPLDEAVRTRWQKFQAALEALDTTLPRVLEVMNRVQDRRLSYAHPTPTRPVTASGLPAFLAGLMTHHDDLSDDERRVLRVMGRKLDEFAANRQNLLPAPTSAIAYTLTHPSTRDSDAEEASETE
jgi:hypothetical protein